MRGRRFIVVITLCIVLAAVWEGRKLFSPSVTPPVVVPAPPELEITPKKQPLQIPKKIAIPKKTAAPKPAILPPAPSVAPPPPVLPPAPLPPQALLPQEWRGNGDSAIKHSGQIVVKNDHQWIRFWAEHHPDEVAPDVDFTQNMVVGVFVGRRPADAFRVDITGIRTLPDAVVVDFIERAPPPGTFQVAVEAYPYDIKVIPLSPLHVKFNQLTAQYQPSPYQRPTPSTASAVAPK